MIDLEKYFAQHPPVTRPREVIQGLEVPEQRVTLLLSVNGKVVVPLEKDPEVKG